MNRIVLVFLALLATGFCPARIPALAQLGTVREYDWIVEIETQELERFLNFPASPLKAMLKASISYSETGSPARKAKGRTSYQDIFYSECNPVGLKRHNPFSINPGDGIAIAVKHKSRTQTTSESCAAANAIIRVLLDANLNGNMVIAVIVPQSSFGSIVQELHRENFYAAADAPPDTPQYSSIVLHLKSEPSGLSQTMYYTGRTD